MNYPSAAVRRAGLYFFESGFVPWSGRAGSVRITGGIMRTTRRELAAVALALALGLGAAGCGDKKEAIQGLEKLEEICKGKDTEAAKKHVADLREKNGAFKKAWDGAVEGIEPDRVNYCSVMTHIKVKTTLDW
jgi:hypothetical protein